jgi:hypothetical protein
LAKAKAHFKDVPRMLNAFRTLVWSLSFWFGYKLVDTLFRNGFYQSSVALWGSGYKTWIPWGRDLSGRGLKFDFSIHEVRRHEDGFANNITYKDICIGYMRLLIILKFVY